ncbi:MAG: protein translocase subunit SecD [Chloroflexi bacterium]|nr:protein translocase subunit SecD [Chloroflexota bacterium]MBU1747998.1 protein translocase subunit SecD [Chloroflexota bacterium]MBU1877498.1 protein translocase subunit SecD [Chloroflexota bacterium]
MRQKDYVLLAVIILVALTALWIDWGDNPGIHIQVGDFKFDRDIKVLLGLDLGGGTEVVLEAIDVGGVVTETTTAPGSLACPPFLTGMFGSLLPTNDQDPLGVAQNIIERRVDALGVTEARIHRVGENRILVEMPGIQDPELAIRTIRETGFMEFVDAGVAPIPVGTVVETSLGSIADLTRTQSMTTTPPIPTVAPSPTAVVSATATVSPTAGAAITTTTPVTTPVRVYQTVMTGRDLQSAYVVIDQNTSSQFYGKPIISLTFTGEGAAKFAQYTTNNVGSYLAIVIDKRVISSPRVESAITEGKAVIQGQFTLDESRGLAAQLQYGALPIPFRIVSQRVVDPTLGQDSIQKSVLAGLIGVFTVLLFMAIYYRVPGLVADVALVVFSLVTFALFKLIPVALTLPGIAGFLLSIGMAVDANILIFERMKEELREGRSLGASIEAGFDRAWTSIRDSNMSTLITCAILFWFGSNFGAGEVSGFAVTLFVGVVVSMFTAITVTHTIMRVLFFVARRFLEKHPGLLGV